MGKPGSKAGAGLLVGGVRDSEVGAYPLVERLGSPGLWLQGPGFLGSTACIVVYEAWSWALCEQGWQLNVAVCSVGLKSVFLLIGELYVPTQLFAWSKASQYQCM